MVRRIVSRKRKHLGNRTFGGGNTKNRRGKGNKGGKGRAGAYKHNWLRTIVVEGGRKGKRGFRNPTRKSFKEISLDKLTALISKGKIEKNKDGVFEADFKGFKILGSGKLDSKCIVKASRFSKKAKEKIEAAGGEAKDA
ncbi:MAG: uL15m family ribosomal protein [Candidatus Micrarchaeota archaeon]